MSLIRGFFDRVLLIAAVVSGGLVPGFIAQYRQRLGGRLDQARLDLEPWQKIADQLYQGDLEKLIEHHLTSSDPTFHSDGLALQALATSLQQLQAAADALRTDLFHQMVYLSLHLDFGLARATWGDWVPTFALSAAGLVFAAVFALVVWLLFQALWSLIAMLSPRPRRHSRRDAAAPR